MTEPGARDNKLAGLMRMVHRDRGDRHLKEGMLLADRRDWGAAAEELGRALAAFEEMDDSARMSAALSALALCRFGQGDLERAEADSRRSAALLRQMGDREGEGTAMLGLGHVQLAKGELAGAESTFLAALSLFRAEHTWDGVTRSYMGLERALRGQGREQEAEEARAQGEAARRRLVDGL